MTSSRPPRVAGLDRKVVVAAAVDVVAAHGVEGLTMKSLAARLGVTPMATYRYVDSKQALLDLVVGEVLGRYEVRAEGTWQERLWDLFWSSFREVARYPGLADHLYAGSVTEPGRRIMQLGLEIVASSGLPPEEARRVYSDIYAYMLGRLVLRARASDRPLRPAPTHSSGLPGLGELASDEHVRHGFDLLIAGLPQGGTPGAQGGTPGAQVGEDGERPDVSAESGSRTHRLRNAVASALVMTERQK